jgi:anti-sigma B factor antagonist
MSFEVSWTAGLAVITAPAEIDITNAAELRSALLAVTADEPTAIVVDMSGTDYCDSTGLNVLVRAQNKMAGSGLRLQLVVTAPAVQRMLAVTGVGSLFRIDESLSQALVPDPR